MLESSQYRPIYGSVSCLMKWIILKEISWREASFDKSNQWALMESVTSPAYNTGKPRIFKALEYYVANHSTILITLDNIVLKQINGHPIPFICFNSFFAPFIFSV